MRTGAGDCGRLTLEEEAGSGDGHAAYSRRRDRAGVEGSQQPSSVRPSLRPPGKQLTAAAATAGPHSRAPLSAMSFILHQLISFQTYNSEGRRRRLGGGSEPHSSRATRCDGAAVLRPKLARPDNQASRAGRGRAAGAGSCRDFDALHQKDDGFPRFPRSLARFPPFSRSSSLGLIR